MKKKEILILAEKKQFLEFVEKYTTKFRKNNGFGRWLAEYQRMDEWGWFEPKKLKALYITVVRDNNNLSYIYWEAIHYIGAQAVEATKVYLQEHCCEIRVITGEIAVDDDNEKLIDLQEQEAVFICAAMNDEAEENLFRVYNRITNRRIF